MNRGTLQNQNETPNLVLKIVFAGLISTTAMTIVMQFLYRELPQEDQYPLPPEEIATVTEKTVLGKKLNQTPHMVWTLTSHYGYGITLAGVYAAVIENLPFAAVPKGILFGLSVWAGSYLGWLPAFGILPPATRFPPARNWLMIAAHVVWGGTLSLLSKRFQNSS